MKRVPPHLVEPASTNEKVFVTRGGRAQWGDPVLGPLLVPLTTSVNGEPQLTWDDDGQLLMTEIPR